MFCASRAAGPLIGVAPSGTDGVCGGGSAPIGALRVDLAGAIRGGGHRLVAASAGVEQAAPLGVDAGWVVAISLVEVGDVAGVDQVQLVERIRRPFGVVACRTQGYGAHVDLARHRANRRRR